MLSTHTTTLCLTLLAATSLPAQNQSSLLFSPRSPEETRSGSGGTVLRTLQPRAIASVTPRPGGNVSAEKYAPAIGWQTLVGDEDNDGDAHTPGLMGAIDAVLVKPYEFDPANQAFVARTTPIDWLDVYISPKRRVGTFVSGMPGLRPGDCGTYVRTSGGGNGQVRHFLRAEQIINAFGIWDPQLQTPLRPDQLDLDAIAVDQLGNIFLSFEDDHELRLVVGGAVVTIILADGGIAWLPPGAWTPDSFGNVATVTPMSGRIAFGEPGVDGMVIASSVTDQTGMCPTQIVDTDGLAIDPNGGTFTTVWDGVAVTLPDLLFSGETLTGGAVLSTMAGGSIATVNGSALAAPCGAGTITDGTQMGLSPSGVVDSLDGLASLDQEPWRFVVGSSTAIGLGGTITIDIGTNVPFPMIWLGVGVGTWPVSPSVDFRTWFPNTRCFPELYNISPATTLVPVADGFGGFTASFTTFAPVVPGGLVFQAAGVYSASVHLSSPATIH